MRLALALLACLSVPAGAIQVERMPAPGVRGQAAGSGVEVVAGEALVRFSSSTAEADRAASLAAVGARLKAELPRLGWTRVGLPAGMKVADGLALLGHVPGVLDAEPNHAYRVRLAPDDPYFWTQYHLNKIDAPQGWDDEVGNSHKVTIAVVDVGFDASNPDLSPKVVAGSAFCDPGGNKNSGADDSACVAEPTGAPAPACNHATRVAGVAAAATNNNSLVAGVSWAAQLVSVRIFRPQDCTSDCSDASGQSCATDDTAIANAIDYVRTQYAANAGTYGPVVINASIGEAAACPGVIQTAITSAVGAGVTFVAAAGNDGGAVNAPGNCTNAIPVGATDANDSIASFSSRGAELNNNGVVAPGVSLVTTDLGAGITPNSDLATGTSFSAPIVSGLAALLLSKNSALTPAQVQTDIRNGADNLGQPGNNQGAGRVNVCKSLKIVEGQPTTSCASGNSGLAGFQPEDPLVVFPNPFRTSEEPTVTIKVPASMQGQGPSLKVFTLTGQLVRTLTPGATAAVWDGTNDHGNAVASGVYIVLMKAGGATKTFKLAVVR